MEIGIGLSQHQLDLIRIYLDELCDWNRRINLTGLSGRERIVVELFLDSLIPAPFLPKEGRMLDVGSGAGFPGLPLKILNPHLKTHLLEANSKKVSFLKQVIRLLQLKEVKVIRGRIEKDENNLHGDGYHIITARALANLGQTIVWCTPLLCPDGLLVSFLGPRAKEEIEATRAVMEGHGLRVHKMIRYFLPGKEAERNIVLFEKRA
ncbi:MAG: 16S rRNA (guanine(527)-N(7))-methyltransferase RsmG [Desulfobacteraceae bacterium]